MKNEEFAKTESSPKIPTVLEGATGLRENQSEFNSRVKLQVALRHPKQIAKRQLHHVKKKLNRNRLMRYIHSKSRARNNFFIFLPN